MLRPYLLSGGKFYQAKHITYQHIIEAKQDKISKSYPNPEMESPKLEGKLEGETESRCFNRKLEGD